MFLKRVAQPAIWKKKHPNLVMPTVDGSEIPFPTTMWCIKPCKSWDLNYLHLNWWVYRIFNYHPSPPCAGNPWRLVMHDASLAHFVQGQLGPARNVAEPFPQPGVGRRAVDNPPSAESGRPPFFVGSWQGECTGFWAKIQDVYSLRIRRYVLRKAFPL